MLSVIVIGQDTLPGTVRSRSRRTPGTLDTGGPGTRARILETETMGLEGV